jgi:CHAD domain-containing protein
MPKHEARSIATSNSYREATAASPSPALAPDTLESLVFSLKKQWKCYRKELKKCQRKLSERSIHDLRVSARRLLSLLDLLAHFLTPGCLEKTQTELKRDLDTFDSLRDTQVQLMALRKLRQRYPAANRFHRFLKKREARFTHSTCKKARRLRSKPLGKLIDSVRKEVKEWPGTSNHTSASPMLLSAVNRMFVVTTKLRDRIEPKDTHSIHCTRVAFKKFRYVVESLAGHLPRANEKLLANMHRYQTLMGDIQDAEVLLRAYQKFLRKEKSEIQESVRFEHELQRRSRELIDKYLRGADQLLSFWPTPASSPRANRKLSVPANGQADQDSRAKQARALRSTSNNKNV